MHLALTGIFCAHWSEEVHDEWIRNLLKHRLTSYETNWNALDASWTQVAPDALVTGYESLTEEIELPDRDDRHVLAAAIRCGARVIVTLNLSDFPGHALANSTIEAEHPNHSAARSLNRQLEDRTSARSAPNLHGRSTLLDDL